MNGKRKLNNVNVANECADSMLNRITDCFKDSLKGVPQIKSAIVNSVNDDGTVTVFFPPNENKLFTRISNQGPFTLKEGDGVELLLKNGSFNNCWVIAKHGVTRSDMNTNQNKKEEDKSNSNSSSNNISAVGVTKTSQLINDSGFIVSNSPTIYSAKLTGIPTAPTASYDTNNTQVATTSFVQEVIKNKIIGQGNITTSVDSNNNIIISINVTTQDVLTNDNSIATTAFVHNAIEEYLNTSS